MILVKGTAYQGYNEKARRILAACDLQLPVYYAEDPYDIAIELQRKNRIAVLDALFAPNGKENFRYVPLPQCGINFGIQIIYSHDSQNPWLPKLIRTIRDVIRKIDFD